MDMEFLVITGKPNRKQIKCNIEKCSCSLVSNMQLMWSLPKSILEANLFEEYFRNTAVFQYNKVSSWLGKVLVNTFSFLFSQKYFEADFSSSYSWQRNWGLVCLCYLSKVTLLGSITSSYSDSWTSALFAAIFHDMPRTEKLNKTDFTLFAGWQVR